MLSIKDMLDVVSIVGMAGRFSGADDVVQFWKNLCEGLEASTVQELTFDVEELIIAQLRRARGRIGALLVTFARII